MRRTIAEPIGHSPFTDVVWFLELLWSCMVSHVAQIAAFVSLADGALSPEVQARAIRTRWPGATSDEICEAMTRSAAGYGHDVDELIALDAAVASVLGRTPPKPFVKPDDAVRAPFRRHP